MKFNLFNKKTEPTVDDTDSEPTWNLRGLPTHDWEPVEGYNGIEVLVERPVIVQVRKGPIGSRTHGKYRLPVDVDLGDFIADRVSEFTQIHTNNEEN